MAAPACTTRRTPSEEAARPRGPDAGRTGLLLAVPGGLLLTALHSAQSMPGQRSLAPLLAALRDISFALPLSLAGAVLAVPAGLALASAAGLTGGAALLVRATALAGMGGLGLALTNSWHAALFGAHHHGLTPIADSVRLGLVASLVLLLPALAALGAHRAGPSTAPGLVTAPRAEAARSR